MITMVTRFNNKLAEWAHELSKGMSLRQVEIKTKISYATVSGLLDGRQPNAETIIRFARGFNQDIPSALRLAGYDDIAEMWESGTSVEEEVEPNFKSSRADREIKSPDDADMEQPFPPDEDPVMRDTFGYLGRVAKELPPGPARDAYLDNLRRNADDNMELIRKMLGEGDENKKEGE